MVKILLILSICPILLFSQPNKEIVWNALTKNKEVKFTKSVSGNYELSGFPFKVCTKINSDVITFESNGKYLDIEPISIGWDNGIKTLAVLSEPILELSSKIKYKDVFKKGIDINVNIYKRGMSKLVELKSLESLGTIPKNAAFLEIIFKISTNYDFSFVDKSEFKFASNLSIDVINSIGIERVNSSDYAGIYDAKTEGIFFRVGNELFLKKRIDVEYLKKSTFPVVTDLSITYGSESIINSTSTAYTTIGVIDSNHFVVGYVNSSTGEGFIKIGTISGTSISYGGASSFYGGSTSNLSLGMLDSSHFVIAFSGARNFGYLDIGTISGASITFRGYTSFNLASTNAINVVITSSSEFTIVYQDAGNSNKGTARAHTYNGITLTVGNEYIFNNAITSYITACALDAGTFAVFYRDNGNSNKGTSVIGTISGTIITFGTEYALTSSASFTSTSKINSTKFAISYNDDSSGYGTSRICSINGYSVTFGNAYVFNTSSVSWVFSEVDNSNLVITYLDVGNSSYGTTIVGVIDNMSLVFGNEYLVKSAVTPYQSIEKVADNIFVLSFADNSTSTGRAVIGSIETISLGKKINGVIYTKWNNTIITKFNNQ